MLFPFQENDFDFADRQQHLEGIKVEDILSYQPILDDEDLMSDQGSGPFNADYSGTTEVITGTNFSPTRPVFPYTSSPVEAGDFGK